MSKEGGELLNNYLKKNRWKYIDFAKECSISYFSIYKYVRGVRPRKSVAKRIEQFTEGVVPAEKLLE